MKINSLSLRLSLLSIAAFLCFLALRQLTFAQNQQGTKPKTTLAGAKKSQNLKPLRAQDLESKQEGADFLRRRQDWFFKPRAFPLGFIPRGARERALQQMRQMYEREGRLNLSVAPGATGFVTPATGTSSAWIDIGPQPTQASFTSDLPFFPTAGRVTALAVNPKNNSNAYLGGADGGLWMSTDLGTTWTPLTDNPPNAANIPTVAVGAIALDATTCLSGGICTTVYVGTGEDNFGGDNIYGEGVLKCTITAGTPPTALCTQDSTFHTPAPLDDFRGGPMIGALVVNRVAANHNILLAGVRGRASALVSGVYCSSDSGSTWTRVLPTTANLVNGTGDPGSNIAFASDGTAWVALGFPFGDPNNGIYKSTAPITACSPAPSFTQQTLPAAFTSANIGRITLALAPSDNTKIYAAIGDATTGSSALLGVLRSTNATSTPPTWTQLTDPLVSADSASNTSFCSGQCFYDMALSVDATSPDVVYAGGSGAHPIIATTNGTTTASWTDVTAPVGTASVPHVDTHTFAFAADGSAVWVGNDGGVWASNNPASALSWVNLNGTSATSTGALDITQLYPGVSIHPANPGFAMGGTQDNDVQVDQAYLGSSASLFWAEAGLGCDGGYTAIDLTTPSTSYGECEYLPGVGFPFPLIAVTFNGDGILGAGFFANAGIDPNDRGAFITPLVMDPSNTLTLYWGSCRVWQTTDGGASWTAISPDVTSSSHAAGCPIPTAAGQPTAVLSTIAVAPNNSNTIYVGSDRGEVEVTSDGGTTWTSIVTATLPARSVTQVVVDPATAGTAYATFSGFGSCATFCDGKGHIFKTVNGTAGAATVWTEIDGTTTKLPDIPVNAIVIDPNDATGNTLYVGTDIGAFFTTDGGTVTWSPLGALNSMPNAEILSLTLHNPSRTLRAATHGRGVFDLNLGGLSTFAISSINPFSANAGSAAITSFTVNGNGFTANSKIQFALNGTTTTLTPTSSTLPTQLVAAIPQTALASGGLAQVSVTDSTQPTSPTKTLPFTVLNPIPTVFSISPTSTTAGTNGLMLTVNGVAGSNSFVSGANGTVVLFNGSPRPTTFVNSDQLTATLSASDLAVGAVVFIDTFTPQPGGGPDLNGAPPTLTINNPVPTVSSISPTSKAAGSGAFTLTVNGTNFNASSVVNFGANALTPTLQTSTQLQVSVPATAITTAGPVNVTVFNPAPAGGTSTPAQNFSVTATGSFTVAGSNVAVTAGSNNTSTITVTPTGGFTGTVAVTCGTAVPGVSCTPNPLNVNVASVSPASSQLTINVTAPSSSTTAMALPPTQNLWAATPPPSSHIPRAGWWTLSGGTGLAAILFLFLPKRRRYRAALGFGLACFMAFALGCNNYGGGGGGGPVPSTTHMTVSSTKVPSTGANATITVSATVTVSSGYNGSTPTGTVQFFDGATALGNPVTLTNGSTGQIMVTPASAPPFFQLVGTHSVTAHYSGDSKTNASQSGALNITITGQTNLPITGASGGTNANANVSLTIN